METNRFEKMQDVAGVAGVARNEAITIMASEIFL